MYVLAVPNTLGINKTPSNFFFFLRIIKKLVSFFLIVLRKRINYPTNTTIDLLFNFKKENLFKEFTSQIFFQDTTA